MKEMWVWPLSWEDPLEKEMATHSSTLVWKIPWTEEPGRLQSMGSQRVRHNWVTKQQQQLTRESDEHWWWLSCHKNMFNHKCIWGVYGPLEKDPQIPDEEIFAWWTESSLLRVTSQGLHDLVSKSLSQVKRGCQREAFCIPLLFSNMYRHKTN